MTDRHLPSSPARARRRARLPFAAASAATLLALVLGGCSVLPQRSAAPAITAYRIAPQPTAAQQHGNAVCPAVRVAEPTAAAGFTGPAMRYSTATDTIASFAFHRWAAPPAQMLAPVLVRALSGSGLFRSVVAPESPASAPLQLDTHLVALLQQVDGGRSRIHLVVRNSLTALSSRRQLAARRFVVDVPTAAVDPAAGASAANTAVARWSEELTRWLAGRHLCQTP